jgi:hypothetical protein
MSKPAAKQPLPEDPETDEEYEQEEEIEESDSQDEGFEVVEFEQWLKDNEKHAEAVWSALKKRLFNCDKLHPKEHEAVARDAFLEWYYEYIILQE